MHLPRRLYFVLACLRYVLLSACLLLLNVGYLVLFLKLVRLLCGLLLGCCGLWIAALYAVLAIAS